MLPDGTYPVLIVDAAPGDDDDARSEEVLHVELVITTGSHKGEVVALRGRFPGRSELDLLAAPATLTVVDGHPSVQLDE